MMTVIGLVLAALIGIALGLLGGGGAILAVPIFNYELGFDVKEAIASSLAVVGVTSLSGVTSHWREGNVKLRVALAFGLPAAAGRFGAKVLAGFLSGAAHLALFAVMMLVSALFMFRDNDSGKDEEKESDGGDSGTRKTLILLVAVGVGILTGLVGVGGGFLIVPALVLLGNVPMKQAVGTSLLVIAVNSFPGFLGYLGTVEFQWGLMALFIALAVEGASLEGISRGSYRRGA